MNTKDAVILFHSIKLHFNEENYDAVKYNFKTKSYTVSESHLRILERLVRLYGDELKYFLISNFLENPKIWINELGLEESKEVYQNWKQKTESLTYIFKNDVINLLEEHGNINKVILVDKSYPLLMRRVLQEKTELNTLLILNSILKFFKYWDDKLKGDIIWDPFSFKCRKYYSFFCIDKKKYKQILKSEILKHNG